MKRFRFKKPKFSFNRIKIKKILYFFQKINFRKIFSFFQIFKKPIVLSILISAFVGLLAGTLGGIYLAPWLKPEPKEQPDLFLETGLSDETEKEDKQEKVRTMNSIPEVVKEASPAVVSIIVSKYVPIIERYYYNPFGEDSPFEVKVPGYRQKGEELKEVGGGTGFIVSSDGFIVTNKHVVLDEEAEYTVLTNDGQKYSTLVLARDPLQDIAILKINTTGLPTVKLGNSDILEIGQTVIAIGNALGEFRNTVSAGVISGLLRTITATGGGITEQLEEVIQTDAAINKGNSGGPLLNLYGEVIGVNTAMAVEAENIGFAIPINKVKKDITDIKISGRIIYPFLGIRYVLINKALAKENNLPVDYGALIIRGDSSNKPAIIPNSAADEAGLQENDIILEINGIRISQENPLAKLILKYKPGDGITLKILREEKEIIIGIVLGEWQ
jgi:S1-C subfamily serine protease